MSHAHSGWATCPRSQSQSDDGWLQACGKPLPLSLICVCLSAAHWPRNCISSLLVLRSWHVEDICTGLLNTWGYAFGGSKRFQRAIKIYFPKTHERLDGGKKSVKSPAFLRAAGATRHHTMLPVPWVWTSAGGQGTNLITLISQEGSKRFIRQLIARHKMINDDNKHILSARCHLALWHYSTEHPCI